jgi:hypothetical protein
MIYITWALWEAALEAGRDTAVWLLSALDFLAYPTGPLGEWIIAYGDGAVLVAGIGVAIFAASYGGFFNWRKTQAGRALFQFTLALTAVLVLVILARLVSQEYPFRWLARDVIYTWLAISSIRLVGELWRNWRRGDPRVLDIEAKPRKKDLA